MKSGTLVLLLVALGAVLFGLCWMGGPRGRNRASGRPPFPNDAGIRALVDVIRRWSKEPTAAASVGGRRPRPAERIVVPASVCAGLRELTDLDHECAGVVHCQDGRDGTIVAERFDREDGRAMSSSVPTGFVVYHTHARPAYAGGNGVNFPSPHDVLGVVALALPHVVNACSLVAAREGLYCLRAGSSLVSGIRSQADPSAWCGKLAEEVQRLVDRYTPASDSGGYCAGMRALGVGCQFRPWGGGGGGGGGDIAFGLV